MVASTWTVSDLIRELQPDDSFRAEKPFSSDMVACHQPLLDPQGSREDKAAALSLWLAENQPCLFGRMEAKQRRLSFCVLTENDLEDCDQEIRAHIQSERTAWKRLAFDGASHGFLVVAVSETIAGARPGPVLQRLAERLCELYLGVGSSDEKHYDNLMLRIESDGTPVERRRWDVGVNYFSSQGDGRWWHDHRIPGGMAFSMNSVGHMARTQAESALSKNPELAQRVASVPREKLVYWALPRAMKTIGPPMEGSTRGTWLAEHGMFPEDKEPPSFEQRPRYFGGLAGYSENRYKGRYNTDITIPSEYFDPELWELEKIGVRDDLFFTYLHSLSDDDYGAMGIGEELDGDKKLDERS